MITSAIPYQYTTADMLKSPVKCTGKPREEEGGCMKDAFTPGHRHARSDGRLRRKRADAHSENLKKITHLPGFDRVKAGTHLSALRAATGAIGLHAVSVGLCKLFPES